MSGAPLPRNHKDSGSKTVNVKVSGGVHSMVYMDNNDFGGPVRCNLRSSGAALPAGAGAGSGQPQHAADGSINITNEKGISNHVMMSGNRCADSVDIGGDTNVRQPAAQNNPVKADEDELMDLK